MKIRWNRWRYFNDKWDLKSLYKCGNEVGKIEIVNGSNASTFTYELTDGDKFYQIEVLKR